MIVFIGDVHDCVVQMRDVLHRLPAHVRAVVQVIDLWVWPEEADVPADVDGAARVVPPRQRDTSLHWRRPSTEVLCIDGNHHNYWLTAGLSAPTRFVSGLTFLPRGTVMTLETRNGPARVGFLRGADSVLDAAWRRPDVDWWPEQERITAADVDRLLANARLVGGLDILVTHTPPASITTEMTGGGAPHPSSIPVEEAWRALGGGEDNASLELIAGHMHAAFRDVRRRVEVLDFLGVTIR